MDTEVQVVLKFRSEYEKNYFMGQLSDGWGENFVNLEWEGKDGNNFYSAEFYNVKPICMRCQENFVDDCGCEADMDAYMEAMDKDD